MASTDHAGNRDGQHSQQFNGSDNESSREAGSRSNIGAFAGTMTAVPAPTSTPTTTATPSPAANRHHIAVNRNDYERPVFKNPLGVWGSPPPPSKRQKTTPGGGDSDSASVAAGGFRRSNSDAALRVYQQQQKQWTPRAISLSQPEPGKNGGAGAGGGSSTPARTPAQSGGGGSVLPALRHDTIPAGFSKTIENNRVVLVIDSDDEDSGDVSVPAATATATTSVPPKQPLQTPVTPVPPPPMVRYIGPRSWQPGSTPPDIAPPLFMQHDATFLTSLPVDHVKVKAVPVEDRDVRNIRSFPQARLSASQSPVTPGIPAEQIRTYSVPAPASSSAVFIPSDVISPVVLHNDMQQTMRPIGEHLETAVAVDITPAKASASPLKKKKEKRLQQRLQLLEQERQQNFVRYSKLERRPYLRSEHRNFVSQNYHSLPSLVGLPRRQQANAVAGIPAAAVIHVDFLPEEIQHLLEVVRFVHTNSPLLSKPPKKAAEQKHLSLERELKSLLRRQPLEFEQRVVKSLTQNRIPGRMQTDVYAFIADARTGSINSGGGRTRGGRSTTKWSSSTALDGPAALTLKRHNRANYCAHEDDAARATMLSTFVMMREVAGQRSVPGRLRQLFNFVNEVRKLREDGLHLRNEWTNLAGDVITISWTSEDAFICGTTTHMDDRNHQYNRQGNLALASVSAGTLRAYPDHRIARSQVTMTSTSTTAPVADAFDDPWLYTSVVSSDYDSIHDFAFTSGFDKNVQVWHVGKDGGAMTLQGTWKHEGKVNFVVASGGPVCLIATAADVPVQAVRVYHLPSLQEQLRGVHISHKVFSCSRIVDLEGKPLLTDKWAYFPAAVRWGLTEATQHLLLVGYSPRGLNIAAEDDDIPEDCRNSGELCLWDGLTGEAWRILGGTSQNVFEVAWHPTQACFAAATAPNMHSVVEDHVRTQIRIFRLSVNKEYGGRAYSEVQTLDCYADDINELALRFAFMYVAAGCTNGHTYVWDTSQGDHPIHDLSHGDCIEELAGEKVSMEDTGVKFVAWGETADRLYTGSSDGLVKVWNIRTHGAAGMSPYVRNLLQCSAPVSFGAFSPNKSKLAIGDASGRVFLMSVEDGMEKNDEDGAFLSEDEADDDKVEVTKTQNKVARGIRHHLAFKRRPPGIIRHATPPPPSPTRPPPQQQQPSPTASMPEENAAPNEADDDSGLVQARAFLASGQLVVVPDPTIGAVKGPKYADTKLFCLDFHQDRRPERPLLAQFDRFQQENRLHASTSPSRQRPLKSLFPDIAPASSFSSSSSFSPGASVLGAPDPLQALQRQNAVRRVQMQHESNVARDLDVNSLPAETRRELELADRAALLHIGDDDYDYGFDYEEVPADV